MRTIFFFTGVFICSHLYSQKGNDLLVYSLKGEVTVLEGNTESKAKIGKVLKPGSTIKTKRNAKLTMVCKEGRPISLTKEGSFPVELWRDSCDIHQASVTSMYFQYIWDQFYVRGDNYKKEQGLSGTNDAPVRGDEENELVVSQWLDSLNYTGRSFPLSWTTVLPYQGKYFFVLENTKTKKILFRDSLDVNVIQLERLKKYMRAGNLYSWTVMSKGMDMVTGGLIKYSLAGAASKEIQRIKKIPVGVEGPADQYFRIAFTLREIGYPAEAYTYFRKAAESDPSSELYADALKEFKAAFFIQ